MEQTTETKEEHDAIQNLGNTISKGEGGYRSYNTGTAKVRGKERIVISGIKEDMFSLTIDQLHESSKRSPFDKNRVFAAGKYQIITDTHTGTLLAAKTAMKLSGSERFTPELQESIFKHFLLGPIKRKALHDYIQYGKGTLEDAVYSAAQEWASIEVPKGRRIASGSLSTGRQAYYGKGNAAAPGSGAAIAQKIAAARAAYAQAQSGGGTKLPDRPTPIVDESEQQNTPANTKPPAKTKTEPRTKPRATSGTETDENTTDEQDQQTAAKTADEYRGYQLTGSVGAGGENHHDDVIAAQTRLGFFGIHTKADGKFGPNTFAGIKEFQKPFGIRDGLIEVGKKTQRELFSGQITVEVKLDDPAKPKSETTTDTKTETRTTNETRTDEQRTAGGSAQMSKLLAVASSHARGKAPDRRCYAHVKEYIALAGGYGNIKNIQADKRFAGATEEAHMFADRVNAMGPEKFGLAKLGVSTPFEAPDGAIVVVKHGTPGTSDPTAGDITVAGPGTEFYNGGTMHYHGPKAWPPRTGGLLGVYIPNK